MTPASNKLDKFLNNFKEVQHVALATIDDQQPRVRPMTLIYLDRRFWMVTSTASDKVGQIKKNANVEFFYQFPENGEDCCIRVLGKAKIIKDKKTKSSIAGRIRFFHDHWSSPEDPDYTLLEILPGELQHVSPSGATHLKV